MILASLLLSIVLLFAVPSYAASLYFPHVATSSPWQTEIAVINTSSSQTATGTLRAFSNEGQLVETKDVTLSARGRRQVNVGNEFTNHTNIGYIIFDTNSSTVQGYTKFYIAGTYRAAIPAVKEVNTSDIYIPHIASDANWWTGVSLVNTTSAPKELTITFNNGQSRQFTLNANEHRAFDIVSLFNYQPQPDIQSAVITNASGVIGLELFGNIGGSDHLDGILLTGNTASTLYYPHVASDNVWWTGIVAYNPSSSASTLTVTPFSAQGTPLTPSTLSITGKGKYIGEVSALGLPAQTAWFRIDATTPLTGFELFATIDGTQLAAYAQVGGAGAREGVFAKIEKNGWTGIAFVNTAATEASVTLTAYNDNGAAVASQVLPVGGHAKVVNVPEAIFPQDIRSATYIAYSSDRNVVGFQLNGSSDGTMLDGLPGLGVGGTQEAVGRYRLKTRGLWADIFERRGWAAGYFSGEMIQDFNNFDSVVGHTVAEEVALQLDKMLTMGVNSITFGLLTADQTYNPKGFYFPDCNAPPVGGFQWPHPTTVELTNLRAFFDLVHAKGISIILRLTNTHMEEQPPVNSQAWLGAILGVVKDHPALDFIVFYGDEHLIDTNGDGIPDACGSLSEPPLWLGPTKVSAQYVKWAIGYGLSLGIPARKLSAGAIVGDFFTGSQPANPWGTDGHLWSPIVTLKRIYDDLGIPNNERTYALSFYEQRKCAMARGLPCVDTDPHTWADQTLQSVFATIGIGNGARVVAVEMGAMTPVDPAWPTERALESLIALMEKYGVDGGSFWIWVNTDNNSDANPQGADPVKRRGVEFIYTPVQKEVIDMGGFHLTAIPNGSFEAGDSIPSSWTISGNGTVLRYFLAAESWQPEVPTRGNFALRLVTGSGSNDAVSATSDMIAISPNTTYTTTANLRFGWTGDQNPGGNPTTRPQVFISIRYFDGSGVASQVRAQDVSRFYQENSTTGFDTFPLQYTTPSDAGFVRIEIGVARNGLATPITFDADNFR